jgi:hypothetical protein
MHMPFPMQCAGLFAGPHPPACPLRRQESWSLNYGQVLGRRSFHPYNLNPRHHVAHYADHGCKLRAYCQSP